MGLGNTIKDTWTIICGLTTEDFKTSLLLVPLGLALVLRLPLLIWPEVIYNDSVIYVKAAKGILEGRWSETIVPPLYPALIAAAKYITGDFELAGILVSMVFGSLLVIPIFYLGKELYNARVGMVAALLATVQPYLFKYSGSVLTESTYYFLVAVIVLAAHKSYTTEKLAWSGIFGALTAAGYLVRPEAIGFSAVFAGWVLFSVPTGLKRPMARRIMIVFMAGLCFLAFSSPYLIALRNELGRWELSKKLSISIESKEKEPVEAVPPEKMATLRYFSISSAVRQPIATAKAALIGFFICLYKFQQSLTPLLFLLAVWGFARTRRRRQHFFVLSFILFIFTVVLPFFKISARYTSHMIPVALPWAAYGFVTIVDSFRLPSRTGWFSGKTVGTVLAVIMVFLLAQGVVQNSRDHRMQQKEAGLWMKQNLPKGGKLMSHSVQEAFYAEMELVRYDEKYDFEQVVDEARSKSTRYIVIDQNMEKRSPDFLEQAKRQGLVLIHYWEQRDVKTWVFELPEPPVPSP